MFGDFPTPRECERWARTPPTNAFGTRSCTRVQDYSTAAERAAYAITQTSTCAEQPYPTWMVQHALHAALEYLYEIVRPGDAVATPDRPSLLELVPEQTMSNSSANPSTHTLPEYDDIVQSSLQGSSSANNVPRTQHENDHASTRRAQKRPRESSSPSSDGGQTSPARVTLFSDLVPQDVPGPEGMEIDTPLPVPTADAKSNPAVNTPAPPAEETKRGTAATPPTSMSSDAFLAPSSSSVGTADANDSEGSASTPRHHVSKETVDAQRAAATAIAAQLTNAAIGRDASAPLGRASEAAQAPERGNGGAPLDIPLPATQGLPTNDAHAAAPAIAPVPAPAATQALRVGDRYSPFANDPRFANLEPPRATITFLGARPKRVFRPSPSQVVVNTTDQCIRGFNSVTAPKLLAWVQDVGHRNDATGTVADLREHIKALVPGGLADNVRIAPFHALGPVNPAYPMPYYLFVTNIPQAVVDVLAATHCLNCDDGYTFYTCPYDATIRGERYIGAYQWNLPPEEPTTVVAAFTEQVLRHPAVESIVSTHNEAIPPGSRTSINAVRDFLRDSTTARPIKKGNRDVWRVYMHTPTHHTAAFDKLVATIREIELPTTFNGIGRYYHLYPCRMCRSLDHSTDSCDGPVLDTIPGWKRLAAAPSTDLEGGQAQIATLPVPSMPPAALPDSPDPNRAPFDNGRRGRGGGGRQHFDLSQHPYNGRPYRGGRGGRGGGRGVGRGGYFDKTYGAYV
ncbi:hypothetical protein HDZ31DRAFT_76474 [Schizophyllum fasciatum]